MVLEVNEGYTDKDFVCNTTCFLIQQIPNLSN